MRFYRQEEKEKVLERLCLGETVVITSIRLFSDAAKWSPRYCPWCAETNRATYGEAYWHMEHQIPMMTLCLTHRCRLLPIPSLPVSHLSYTFFPLEAFDLFSECEEQNASPLPQILYDYYAFPLSAGVTEGYSNLAITFPDVEAVAEDDSVYHIYVGSCGTLSPIQELQGYAHQYDGSSTELHVIMLSPQSLLDGGQAYSKIDPTILNISRDMPELPSSVYYHVLSAADGLKGNAPGDIQALLDVLGNRSGPTQTPLLEMMDSSIYQWYWVDALRPLKKQTAHRAYHDAVKAGADHYWAMVKCADTEDLVQKEFLEAGVARVNSLRSERSYAVFQVKPERPDYQVESSKEFGCTQSEAMEKVAQKFGISQALAGEMVGKYWG